jgi:flavin reductase (DIM6/NTAB) family NADH-FMN oxidoreductase RutF
MLRRDGPHRGDGSRGTACRSRRSPHRWIWWADSERATNMDPPDEQGPAVSEHDRESASKPLVSAVNYPLYVVTARADAERSGCLAGFVTQSSIKPVQFLVCVSKLNHTFGTAQRSHGLALHVLGSDQRNVARHFGELTGDEVDKFEGIGWSTGRTGVPILSECAAWVEGPIIGRIDGGDHEAFLIGELGGGAGGHEGCFMLRDATGFRPGHPE